MPRCSGLALAFGLSSIYQLRELALTQKSYPLLEAGSSEQNLLSTLPDGDDPYGSVPDFVISNQCLACETAGYTIGDPYPALHNDVNGLLKRIDGWDSRVPIFHALENPEACNIVPAEEVVDIGEWDFFYTARYSDACDYVMQCMYEVRWSTLSGLAYAHTSCAAVMRVSRLVAV